MTKHTKNGQESLKFAYTFSQWWTENQEEVLKRTTELDQMLNDKWAIDKNENLPYLLATLLTTAAKVFVAMDAPKGAPKVVMQSIFNGYNSQIRNYVHERMNRKAN